MRPQPPGESLIREALDKILISRGFANSDRMQRFLRYTVEQSLEGHSDALKEYAIGVEVFDRAGDYDPRVDSIVRVEARRLRSKLTGYYSGEGKAEPVRISFPPGGYVPVFETSTAVNPPTGVSAASVTGDTRAAIAVLPFTSLSGDPENEIFADGLTDELIHALSRLDQLRVVSRTTAFHYKHLSRDVREIGRTLNVASVVEGSVRRADNRLRVTAQLIDAGSGYELWSGQFDREITDIFAIQEELADAICRVLRIRLSSEARQIVPMDAYQFYLEGLFYSSRVTPADLREGIERFTRALVVEPRFAAAQAGLAGCYAQMMLFGEQSPRDLAPLARAALHEALALNPHELDALCWQGFVQAAFDWDWAAAEASFGEVIRLSPSHSEARQWYSFLVLFPQGRLEEAQRHCLEAARLDPFSLVSQALLAFYHYAKHEPEETLAILRRVEQIDPGFYGAHRLRATAYLQIGEFEQAVAVLESGLALAGSDSRIRAALGYTLAYAGREADALKIAQQLDTEAEWRYISPFDRAIVRLGLAHHEEAVEQLWRAAEEHSVWLTMLNIDPVFDEIRSIPRYQALVDLVFGHSTERSKQYEPS